MTFAREGFPFMALGASAAVTVLAVAVWRRSWSLWLLGYFLLVIAAGVAWFFRSEARDGQRGEHVVTVRLQQRTIAGTTVIAERPV